MDRATTSSARILAALAADSRRWGISLSWALVALVGPIVLLAAVALTGLVSRDLFRAVTAEDSLLEWIQVAALLVTVVALGRLTVLLVRDGERARGLLFGTLALGAFFVAAEEVSWGQRIIGLVTPDELDAINKQGELNLHNIETLEKAFYFGELVVGVFAVLVPILYAARRMPFDRIRHVWLFIPPLALMTLFALPAAYRAIRFATPVSGFLVTRIGETLELPFYLAIALVSWLAMRRYGHEVAEERLAPPAEVLRSA